uniref:Putative secreted protein n=1 Tax=Ixodes ricinus TaxID=34613 RepID=A0A6B0UWU4_IXORI
MTGLSLAIGQWPSAIGQALADEWPPLGHWPKDHRQPLANAWPNSVLLGSLPPASVPPQSANKSSTEATVASVGIGARGSPENDKTRRTLRETDFYPNRPSNRARSPDARPGPRQRLSLPQAHMTHNSSWLVPFLAGLRCESMSWLVHGSVHLAHS